MRTLAGASLGLLLINTPFAQEIASVDLSRPPGPSKPAASQGNKLLPNGCEIVSDGIIADGWVEPEDHQPRNIVVEVLDANETKPHFGSELEAKVKLRNADTRPIQIPWSTDPSVIEDGQDPGDLRWDAGTFEFTLKNSDEDQIALKSLTGWLYGSRFSAGSQLTIRPGESIVARVKFKLEDQYAIKPGQPEPGEWQLLAEWHQVSRSRRVANCKPTNTFFQYDHFYTQQNSAITIQVTPDDTTTSGRP